MRNRPLAAALAALAGVAAVACTKKPDEAPVLGNAAPETTLGHTPSPSATVTPSAAVASASGSAATPAPVCTVKAQKGWGKGINTETGLTATELGDGRVAIGFASGLTPSVLVVGHGGAGRVVKITPNAGTDLANAPKANEGQRHLMRVTPVNVDGDKVDAFADYHDDYRSKRRRVACGPASGDDPWIVFDNVPWFDRKDPPTGDERKKLFAKKNEQGADAGYHELRDCRTFSDKKKGETWVVGSVLRGLENGTDITWKHSLVVDRGSKIHELHEHDIDAKDEANAKSHKFEVPMSAPLAQGGFVMTSRFGDTLYAGLLNDDKTLKGGIHTYAGFATLPDIARDGNDTILSTAIAKGNGDFSMETMRLKETAPELPKALAKIQLVPDDRDSETDPDFTRDGKGRRWLSYVDGARGKGKLFIVPVDAALRATGVAYEITQNGEVASEAKLVPVGDHDMLVVFIRESPGDKTFELVTEDLECEVVKPEVQAP